jgi:UDP-3-O-[3-hydroxymyristoyl] N-acetylglucosamine deacetylase/3-hydroxyacyl-[acyl-carrier-protein] dehydratase
MEKQKTIKDEIVLSGKGLHTGHSVTVRLKPAAVNTGVVFRRVDLPGRPQVVPELENVMIDNVVPRCTSIRQGNVVVHTVEHFMAALSGYGVDNIQVEIDSDELPGLDGSGRNFLDAIRETGTVAQEAPRQVVKVREPLSVANNGASILIVPADDLKISYALNYDHPVLKAQFFSRVINRDTFEKEIAPSRTFCLQEEVDELQARGLGQGASYENTLVVGSEGVIKNQVRFPDEFARHKVLDIIGDLYLLGKPLRGHVFAICSGHSLNIELLKKVRKQQQRYSARAELPRCDTDPGAEMDICRIMKILPHRYPFLLVDRIVDLKKGAYAVGVKNVTINDQFFCGHFPARPIMPGVLMIEAMAQVGGILMLTNEIYRGKVALFMATDKVKFRKLVEPGDQLVMRVEVIRERSRTASLKGVAKVGDEVVTEAEMVFSFLDEKFLEP